VRVCFCVYLSISVSPYHQLDWFQYYKCGSAIFFFDGENIDVVYSDGWWGFGWGLGLDSCSGLGLGWGLGEILGIGIRIGIGIEIVATSFTTSHRYDG
jgi:hypothetical protein